MSCSSSYCVIGFGLDRRVCTVQNRANRILSLSLTRIIILVHVVTWPVICEGPEISLNSTDLTWSFSPYLVIRVYLSKSGRDSEQPLNVLTHQNIPDEDERVHVWAPRCTRVGSSRWRERDGEQPRWVSLRRIKSSLSGFWGINRVEPLFSSFAYSKNQTEPYAYAGHPSTYSSHPP